MACTCSKSQDNRIILALNSKQTEDRILQACNSNPSERQLFKLKLAREKRRLRYHALVHSTPERDRVILRERLLRELAIPYYRENYRDHFKPEIDALREEWEAECVALRPLLDLAEGEERDGILERLSEDYFQKRLREKLPFIRLHAFLIIQSFLNSFIPTRGTIERFRYVDEPGTNVEDEICKEVLLNLPIDFTPILRVNIAPRGDEPVYDYRASDYTPLIKYSDTLRDHCAECAELFELYLRAPYEFLAGGNDYDQMKKMWLEEGPEDR